MSIYARPYARAIFELAAAQDRLPQWTKILAALTKIIQNPQIKKLLKNPKLTAAQQAEIILALLEEDSKDSELNNFVKLLAENKRLMVIPEIAQLFAQYREESERVLNVRVSSVIELPEDIRKKLQEILNKKLGKSIKLHNEINPDLMGGIVIHAGDLVIDGSVRGQLERLRANLIN